MADPFTFNAPTYTNFLESDDDDDNDIWNDNGGFSSSRMSLGSNVPEAWITTLRENSGIPGNMGNEEMRNGLQIAKMDEMTNSGKEVSDENGGNSFNLMDEEELFNAEKNIPKIDVEMIVPPQKPQSFNAEQHVHGSPENEEFLDEYIPSLEDTKLACDVGAAHSEEVRDGENVMVDRSDLLALERASVQTVVSIKDIEVASGETMHIPRKTRKGTPITRKSSSFHGPAAPPQRERVNQPPLISAFNRVPTGTSSDTSCNERTLQSHRLSTSNRMQTAKSSAILAKRNSFSSSQPKKTQRLTEPRTPFLFTSARSKKPTTLSSVDIELQTAKLEKKMLDRLHEQSSRYLQEAKQTVRSQAITKKPLTEPHSPKLASSRRPHAIANLNENKVKPASRPTATGPGPVRLTRPQPFSLSEPKGHPRNDSIQFVPIAVQVKKFQMKTPMRFHTRPEKDGPDLPSPVDLSLTEPKEPHFQSDLRLRGTSSIESHEGRELSVIKEMKPFKARPVSRKVLNSAGDLGVPKVNKKKPTTPVAFVSHTERRALSTKRDSFSGSSIASLAGSIGHGSRRTSSTRLSHKLNKPQSTLELTEVKPFRLSTDSRAAARGTPKIAVPKESTPMKFVSRKVPDFSKAPLLPHIDKKPITVLEPFNLPGGKIHDEAQRRLKENIDDQNREAAKQRNFKANSVPIQRQNTATVEINRAPLTDPETPATLRRSHLLEMERVQKLEEIEKARINAQQFKAHPIPSSTFHKTFSPTLHHRMIKPANVRLASNERARHRANFDCKIQEKSRLEAEEKRQQEELEHRRQIADTAKFRRSLVLKAQPMPDYSLLSQEFPSANVKSPQRLTHPESPMLHTKKRDQQRNAATNQM